MLATSWWSKLYLKLFRKRTIVRSSVSLRTVSQRANISTCWGFIIQVICPSSSSLMEGLHAHEVSGFNSSPSNQIAISVEHYYLHRYIS